MKKSKRPSYRYGTRTGRRLGGKLADMLQVVTPAKSLGPVDDYYIRRAEAKQERRRLRNLKNWSRDKNWHKELAK